MMKLLFLSGTRAEWGYSKPIIDLCRAQGIDHRICVTNMMVLPEYGNLGVHLKKEGYNITSEIPMGGIGHTHYDMARALSEFFPPFIDLLEREKPTWLVLAGDRGEQLMAAIAGGYTYTPMAHIQAGELSGNIDGVARHAIGKFAHLHFAANDDAGARLKKLGEEEFRIHVVGHPALDELVQGKFPTLPELEKKHDLHLKDPYLLVVLHPVTEDLHSIEAQTQAFIDAMGRFPQTKIWILPNNDAGGGTLREMIETGRTDTVRIFDNLPRTDYLGFLKNAACIVGNSSSGLLEAPTFHVPAVNVGRRQWKRVRGANVIDAEFDAVQIEAAVKKAMTKEFRALCDQSKNPYGDGHSAQRILELLKKTPIDEKLLIKRLTY